MYKKYLLALTICILFSGILFAGDPNAQKKVYKATIENGIQSVEIVGGRYYFAPDYIIVKVNVLVELNVKKDGFIVPHDIVMNEPEAGIVFKESLSTGSKTIKFTPQKVGKFHFYCDKKLPFFKSHREEGMEGVLEVVE